MKCFVAIVCCLISACAGKTSYSDVNEHVRVTRQNHGHQPLQAEHINYRPFSEVPSDIKQLVQLQNTREPIVHLPAQSHVPTAPAPAQQYQHPIPVRPAPGPQVHEPEPQQLPIARPTQYNPKVHYTKAPAQPTYKGIQAVQAGIHPGPLPLRGQSVTPTSVYTPKYKTAYSPLQKPDASSVYKSVYNQQQQLNNYKAAQQQRQQEQQQQQLPAPNAIYRPQAHLGQYQAQTQAQFPKSLPQHIQKIIESQRSYQG